MQVLAVHVCVLKEKHPVPPVGVTVINTLSPGDKPDTVYDKTLPIAPIFTTGFALI